MKYLKIIISSLILISFSSPSFSIERDLGDGWCKDVRIHFFAGCAEGDGFAGIVQTGAEIQSEIQVLMLKFYIQSCNLK